MTISHAASTISNDESGLAEERVLPTPIYMKGLNGRQCEAVECLDGPLLVLAGAGSGKTKTLTTRLAHLLCSGKAWPSQILAVTFTNRAAREMRQRVENMAGLRAETLPWLGTFHSICAKLLRRHAEIEGLTGKFTILDTEDQLRLLKQLIKAEGIDEKRWPARLLAGLIDRWKNKCLLPDKVPTSEGKEFDQKGVLLYKQYQNRLRSLNSVDFGDLIQLVVKILRENDDVLENYRRSFKYILVDEYQDTNTSQYLWLQLLAMSHKNICCVGDDDQSIYGWRGAEIENILRFEHSFPGARIVRLEQNYRSTAHILGAASAVISNNRGRLGKTLWTEEQGGEKVRVIGCMDPDAEARWIASEIENLSTGSMRRLPYQYHDVAVLVRAAFQMRQIEDRFLALGLPYQVIGGPRFYERREIRDALAYFRLAVSSSDDLAFERIVNTPRRGVGEKGQLLIQNTAREESCSLLDATRKLLASNCIKGRAATGLKELSASVARWSQLISEQGKSLEETAGQILDESGLPEMWQREKTPESAGRLENLKELVKSMREFENMAGFLEHVSLVYDNLEDTQSSKVSLMTLHAAKGLEFPVVFLPGWEEEVFPTRRAIEDNAQGVEEERRLAYVGITRAEKLCSISFCATRFHYGEGTANRPSRFVEELPSRHVEVLTSAGMFSPYQSGRSQTNRSNSQLSQSANSGSYSSPGFRRMTAASQKAMPTMQVPRARAAIGGFKLGERVFNVKFGYGAVDAVSDDKLLVNFEQAGCKRIVASHVQKADGSES